MCLLEIVEQIYEDLSSWSPVLFQIIFSGMAGYLILLLASYVTWKLKRVDEALARRQAVIATHAFIESMLKFFAQLLVVIVAFILGGLLWAKLT